MPGYISAERFILSREFFGMKLGLANITEFLDLIGRPQNNFKTIHFAGTNGKGSCCAMLASVLRAQGYKTGLFTSPHLVTLRERISVNGRLIPKASLNGFVNRNRKELVRRKLSFFELVTAMALDHFSRVGVDIAVIETGLGGRLDATNVLNPELTVTTEISRDHVEILGRTIRKIAYEKAGIVKQGTPHLTGHLPAPAEEVIHKACRLKKAPLYKLNKRDYSINTKQFSFKSTLCSIARLKPSLPGEHQLRNAALVVKAANVLNKSSLSISSRAIKTGLASTVWPGRFQIIKRKRKPDLILDVAHNVSGIKAFVETFKTEYLGQKAYLVTGFVKRKEHQEIFSLLAPITAGYSLVPLNTQRTINIDELINSLDWQGISLKRFGSLKTAYTKLLSSTSSDDIIVVIGSHFLVGEFLDKIGIK